MVARWLQCQMHACLCVRVTFALMWFGFSLLTPLRSSSLLRPSSSRLLITPPEPPWPVGLWPRRCLEVLCLEPHWGFLNPLQGLEVSCTFLHILGITLCQWHLSGGGTPQHPTCIMSSGGGQLFQPRGSLQGS